MALCVLCRDGKSFDVDATRLPDSPLRHILCGHSGLCGTATLDVDASVLQLAVVWLTTSVSDAMRVDALHKLDDRRIDEAIEWADYLVIPNLRQQLQLRVLRGRIKQAEEARMTGTSQFDPLATLTAFERSGREMTVLKGLSPADISATIDAAKLLQLKCLRLGSEFPRALVVARGGVQVDLRALGMEHAPRTARVSKHGSGGSRRRRGGRA